MTNQPPPLDAVSQHSDSIGNVLFATALLVGLLVWLLERYLP